MSKASQYARNMARLSARIFGEPVPELKKHYRHVNQLSQLPYYKDKEFTNWYPPVQDISDLMSVLRNYGLYVDEHKDFTEEMERQRQLRGKGKKQKQ